MNGVLFIWSGERGMVAETEGFGHRSSPAGSARDPDSLACARSVFLISTALAQKKNRSDGYKPPSRSFAETEGFEPSVPD